MKRSTRLALLLALVWAWPACGSKSGLLAGDDGVAAGGGSGADAGMPGAGGTRPGAGGSGLAGGSAGGSSDGGAGGGPLADAGEDAPDLPDVCVTDSEALRRQRAEVVFVVDRSNSMQFNLAGNDPRPGEPRRWDLMRDAFAAALEPEAALLSVGARMYPSESAANDPGRLCELDSGLDLGIGPGRVDAFIELFETTQPGGGTPTAAALESARAALAARPPDGAPRFLVLATDGAPNCNPSAAPDPADCQCTWLPGTCADPGIGPFLCLDDAATIAVIERTFRVDAIPVFVVGISDANPLFVNTLNRMAEAGGRPLQNAPRRYYDVVEASDLQRALSEISASIARCVFRVPSLGEAVDTLTVGADVIPRDPTRQDGWDLTAPGEITLFGSACELAQRGSPTVRGATACE